MNRWHAGIVLMCLTVACTVSTAQAVVIFQDDFNRPDGSVGNGWSDTSGNINGNLELKNGEVTSSGTFGDAGIFRPIPFTSPLNISAMVKETDGDPSAPRGGRYEAFLRVLNDGTLGSGYGIRLARSDAGTSNSAVHRYDGGTLVDIQFSTFQFDASVDVNFTVFLDGSITGLVTDGSNTFDFNFGAYAYTSSGQNLEYDHGFPGPHPLNPTQQRMDNLVVSAVPEPTTALLALFGLGMLAFARQRRSD